MQIKVVGTILTIKETQFQGLHCLVGNTQVKSQMLFVGLLVCFKHISHSLVTAAAPNTSCMARNNRPLSTMLTLSTIVTG